MIRLAIRVRHEQAELVLAELLELAPAGVEESEPAPGVVEYAVYGAPGELPALPELDALAGGAVVEVSTSEIGEDWSERWKAFHKPVLVRAPAALLPAAASAPALAVRPPWEPADAACGALDVVIDPGQAFGTGSHATTRLCLELLLALRSQLDRPGPLIDVGAGSGVLAIAASKLGFHPVLALDNDRDSVAATGANAAANAASVQARAFDLRAEKLPAAAAGATVLANLLRPLLLDLAGALALHDGRPRHLIAGGLLGDELDEVSGAFAERAGLRERARRHEGEWAALWLTGDA